jgi:hypothetical protein
MKFSLRISLVLAAALLIGAGSAKADTLLYFALTGPVSATFQLPSAPAMDPSFVDVGFAFMITPTDLKINNVASDDFLVFYTPDGGGAFAAFDSFLNDDLSLAGPQIFGGSDLMHPIFTPTGNNPFQLTDFNTSEGGYVLTISTQPTGVPEPSTLLLLAAGLLPLGLLAKRLF